MKRYYLSVLCALAFLFPVFSGASVSDSAKVGDKYVLTRDSFVGGFVMGEVVIKQVQPVGDTGYKRKQDGVYCGYKKGGEFTILGVDNGVVTKVYTSHEEGDAAGIRQCPSGTVIKHNSFTPELYKKIN